MYIDEIFIFIAIVSIVLLLVRNSIHKERLRKAEAQWIKSRLHLARAHQNTLLIYKHTHKFKNYDDIDEIIRKYAQLYLTNYGGLVGEPAGAHDPYIHNIEDRVEKIIMSDQKYQELAEWITEGRGF